MCQLLYDGKVSCREELREFILRQVLLKKSLIEWTKSQMLVLAGLGKVDNKLSTQLVNYMFGIADGESLLDKQLEEMNKTLSEFADNYVVTMRKAAPAFDGDINISI